MARPGRGGDAHPVKGQAVAFTGRFEPHAYTTRDGRKGVAYELHDVALDYGTKPRARDMTPTADEDIPF